jgi:L-threonylcarbamoyladenylate synthase
MAIDITHAVQVLKRGGVVAYPTDTFYGLAVDPRNAVAVGRLFTLKGRDATKPSPLIAASVDQAELAVLFDDRARALAAAFWPGPLSIVLPARSMICAGVLGGGATAAVRVPDDEVARRLAGELGFCITATSANLSGNPSARSVAEIDAAVRDGVDYIVDAGAAPGGSPSTIVDLTTNVPRLIRAGAIAWNRVLDFFQ